jgi:hypothetical protein
MHQTLVGSTVVRITVRWMDHVVCACGHLQMRFASSKSKSCCKREQLEWGGVCTGRWAATRMTGASTLLQCDDQSIVHTNSYFIAR